MTARVISLVPSLTETLLAWGVRPVGVTRFCEHPEIPAFGGTKNPATERIVETAPDLVLMDRQENRREDWEYLRAHRVEVWVSDVTRGDQVPAVLSGLAQQLDLEPAGLPGTEPFTARDLSPGQPTRKPVWVPIWRRPWMSISGATYGHWVLGEAGFANLYADASDPYPVVELEEVARLGPELILAPSEPYSWKPSHLEELSGLAPVIPIDGQDLFWWGVRTPLAAERIRAAVEAAGR